MNALVVHLFCWMFRIRKTVKVANMICEEKVSRNVDKPSCGRVCRSSTHKASSETIAFCHLHTWAALGDCRTVPNSTWTYPAGHPCGLHLYWHLSCPLQYRNYPLGCQVGSRLGVWSNLRPFPHNTQSENTTGGYTPGSTMWEYRVDWLPHEYSGTGTFGVGPPHLPLPIWK